MERATKLARDDDVGGADGEDVAGTNDGGDELLGSHSGLDLTAFALGTREKLVETLNAAQELPESMQRIIISPEQPILAETAEVCYRLAAVGKLRKKWLFKLNEPSRNAAPNTRPFDPFQAAMPPSSGHTYKAVAGVYQVYAPQDTDQVTPVYPPGTIEEYYADLRAIMRVVEDGPSKTFCFRRLLLLEARFNMHILLNENVELAACKKVASRDFYNVRKVDTHIHHSAIMNQKHLLKFIKKKMNAEPDETVLYREGKYWTLQEVFQSLGLTVDTLSVDTLDVHADHATFHRFDRFNLKYNPCGQSRLREIFLKTENHMGGRYLAEITREVFQQFETHKYHYAEPRLSIYGRKRTEWSGLARWVVDHRLYSDHVRWMVQIPRLYNVFREEGSVQNFQQMIDNIFEPLFAVTLDPSCDEKLHLFLQQLCGFDSVDDESKSEFIQKGTPVPPAEWTSTQNPPYGYYLFYLYANLYSLNHMRQARGFSTFALRPHAGEAGSVNHLASAFLLSENISHGITLRKAPVLQYMYYLAQIGISVSPLSNNKLFLDLNRSPFLTYFRQGLNVTLSTDDPLMFHFTVVPLAEEYSVAAQVWKLGPQDVCEIARNSVYICGFNHECKVAWLGPNYTRFGAAGNDIRRTNVPDVRLQFRQENLLNEAAFLFRASRSYPALERDDSFLIDMAERYSNGQVSLLVQPIKDESNIRVEN